MLEEREEAMQGHPYLALGRKAGGLLPNRWDVVAVPLILGAVLLVLQGLHQAAVPIGEIEGSAVSLDPSNLPDYALRTTLRMLAALGASLVFTFIYATLAAKSRYAEMILVPVLDVLQSVPVLGYISFTVVFFLSLFPGSVMGAELACVFAIFTSQAWNMAFSFYQSLRTVPRDLEEASYSFRFSAWQRFWRLEVPFAMPGLIWNMMMSMSGGWFFVVASEAITVGDKTITLPGIGAYVATAIDQRDLSAVGWAILAMTVVILIYDQFLFRPLVAWSDKFRCDQTASQMKPESWVLNMFLRTRLLTNLTGAVGTCVVAVSDLWLRLMPVLPALPVRLPVVNDRAWWWRALMLTMDVAWYGLVVAGGAWVCWQVVDYVAAAVTWDEVGQVALLGLYTLIRVTVLIAVATVIWVPLGVMIGLRPWLAERVQPLAQFLAAFPANLLFPVAVVGIVTFHLNPDIWLSPLMILGTQWYILFNVIAGATAFPNDLREAADNFRIRGWQWWRTVMLPGILPYYVTGAITASGGAWNASIVAEVVSWGDTKLHAAGIGAYIADNTASGDYPHIVLGIAVMSAYVILFNRTLWRPLYRYAERKMRLG
jgi:NitT/TauT family transport system permease protein